MPSVSAICTSPLAERSRDDAQRRRPAGDEPVADHLLAADRVGRLAERLGEVERLAPADGGERARGEQRADRAGGDRRAGADEARGTSPEREARGTLGPGPGDRRPEGAPAQRREHGRQEREARGDHDPDAEGEDRAHLARGVEVGEPEHQHRPGDDRPGGQDRRSGALGGGDHRLVGVPRPAQLLAEPRDDQQAVVGARAEHQHDQDRGRLAADTGDAGGDESVHEAAGDQVGERDDEQRHECHERRAVGREQQQQEHADGDRQERLVDPLDRRAPIGLEAGATGDERPQPGLVAVGRRDDLADRLDRLLGGGRRVVGHQDRAEDDAVVGGDEQRLTRAHVERVVLAARELVGRPDGRQARDRARPAQREGVGVGAPPVVVGDAAGAEVGDHRAHLAAAPEPLVDDPLGFGGLRSADEEGLALVGGSLAESRLQRHRGRGEREPCTDHDPPRPPAGGDRGEPGEEAHQALGP